MKQIQKWLLLIASMMCTQTFFLACNADLPDEEDEGETFQIYLGENPSIPYTGSGKVYAEEGIFVLGTITGGKLTLNLPKTVSEENLILYQFSDGITVSPADVKMIGLDFDDGFYFAANDKEAIYYMKETAIASDILAYVYSIKAATITGTHTYLYSHNDEETHIWNVSFQSGWNTMWVHMNGTFDNYTEATIKTDLVGMPSDLKWVCY